MAVLGRPKLLDEKLLEKARGYLEQEQELPSIESFALYLKINRDTVYDWAKTSQDFSDIYEEIKAKQAQALINNGVKGTYNSTITKLMLTKHGYTDKQEVEHSGEIKINLIDYANSDDTASL